jgi:hypothetical protein
LSKEPAVKSIAEISYSVPSGDSIDIFVPSENPAKN